MHKPRGLGLGLVVRFLLCGDAAHARRKSGYASEHSWQNPDRIGRPGHAQAQSNASGRPRVGAEECLGAQQWSAVVSRFGRG